jgi:opacity protein-like surface antigen
MKNTLLAIALATAGLVALPVAHAADSSGFFINGNIGQSNLSKGAYDDSDTGYAANIGYRWAVAPSVLIGVEGGYTDLGSIAPKSSYGFLGNAKITGWNVGANAHFNLTDNWYLSGRAGLFRANLTGGYVNSTGIGPDGTPIYGVTHIDDSSNKWYAGAGFGYDFNNNFSVGLNYDYYKAAKNGFSVNPDLVSVSGEYRF